ncbi:uncharacterized protein LOC114677588 [Macaca mulatta]
MPASASPSTMPGKEGAGICSMSVTHWPFLQIYLHFILQKSPKSLFLFIELTQCIQKQLNAQLELSSKHTKKALIYAEQEGGGCGRRRGGRGKRGGGRRKRAKRTKRRREEGGEEEGKIACYLVLSHKVTCMSNKLICVKSMMEV